jgi:putative transcriptional regulator
MTKAMACLLLTSSLAWTQDLVVGEILAASMKSHDADFAQTVILIVRHDRRATVGLFVNRPLNIPLSEVYPELKGAQLKLYAGGPVTIGIRALHRSRIKEVEAAHIFDDVSMISTKTLLGKMVAEGMSSSVFRVYAGYTGWSPGQLEGEVDRGLWHVFAGEAGLVFDAHPETLWSRLIGRLPRGELLQYPEHIGEIVGPGLERRIGF